MSACGGSTPASPTPATTNVTMSDPATCAGPNGPYSHVYVTVKDVEASTSANATSGFVDLTPALAAKPMQIDLLGQASTQCTLATLGSTTALQAGDYQQIRLLLEDNSSASLVAGNQCGATAANCVVLNGGTVEPIQLSSESQTGIKIPSGQIAGGQFVVAAGQTKDLDIDFNTCSSLVTAGNGQVRLKPVLHAGELGTSTSVTGTVVDKATGSAIVGGNVMVALEQKDAAGMDRVMMATSADTSGNFIFCPVPAGTYDIVATGVSGANVAYAATVTTGVANGTAMGNIPLVAEAGVAGTAPGSIAGQVTTSTGSAATAADVTLSALQAASVGGASLTFTMPLVQQSAATANVATAAGVGCALNTDCASYTLSVPAAAANAGVYAAAGTQYTQGSGAADYAVEGQAAVPSSGGTADCSPSTEPSAITTADLTLAVTPGASVTASVLAFSGCQ
ncbi:MAG TPA: DUF4382 domain-containing protein [Terriglobales bacterium]|nr:DUF4382 domain-containing protein [Terriglobales bacterium]